MTFACILNVFIVCIMQEFLDSTLKLYHADLQAVDFIGASDESRQLINKWVEEQTESENLLTSNLSECGWEL